MESGYDNIEAWGLLGSMEFSGNSRPETTILPWIQPAIALFTKWAKTLNENWLNHIFPDRPDVSTLLIERGGVHDRGCRRVAGGPLGQLLERVGSFVPKGARDHGQRVTVIKQAAEAA